MGFVSSLKALILGEETGKGNVMLLVKVTYRDRTTGEQRLVVPQYQIQAICDKWTAREDVSEVWVYQKIYHNLKSYTDDTATATDAAVGVMAAGAFAFKR